jgi:hypothetical protein
MVEKSSPFSFVSSKFHTHLSDDGYVTPLTIRGVSEVLDWTQRILTEEGRTIQNFPSPQ